MMIKKLIFATTFLMTIFVFGQKQSDIKAVEQVAERFRLALISGDKNDLQSLILPELSYGHSSGNLQNATEFVESLVSKKSDFLTIDITKQTVEVVGKTAIIRHHLFATTNDLGKGAGEVNLDILLVWAKTKNGWKLFARQAVRPIAKI